MNALRNVTLAAAVAIGALTAPFANAQVGPSAAEAARYQGLHAAAHAGDAARIAALAAGGVDFNTREGNGRAS